LLRKRNLKRKRRKRKRKKRTVKKQVMNRQKMRRRKKKRRKRMKRNKTKMKKRKQNQKVRLQLKTYDRIDLNFTNIIKKKLMYNFNGVTFFSFLYSGVPNIFLYNIYIPKHVTKN